MAFPRSLAENMSVIVLIPGKKNVNKTNKVITYVGAITSNTLHRRLVLRLNLMPV